MADEYSGDNGGIAEGGGSGGGSEAVHEERRRISGARTIFGVIFIVLALVIVATPIVRALVFAEAHGPLRWLYVSVWIIIAVAAAAFGSALLRKSA